MNILALLIQILPKHVHTGFILASVDASKRKSANSIMLPENQILEHSFMQNQCLGVHSFESQN